MKQLLLLIALLISTVSFAQFITLDKIDDFTDVRSILIQNSKTKDLGIQDNISENIDNGYAYISIGLDKHSDSDLKKSLIIGLILKQIKCFYGSQLSLLFENGEKFTLEQSTRDVCNKGVVVGFLLPDTHFTTSKNNLLKKIRITDTKGHTDYTIDKKQQENIKKTFELAFSKYQELQQ
ncbi:hypothetical protein [Myroides marinus]|uniref:hypothetical protein n=1 Tax=Myroides marinus TaxID=703342 RepID=UPI0025766BD4|nr:hypothetical protein [Myroides marinus]MDM1378796.1 hypothetical protein [Myroides marinus]MDM1386067.1 hypothetical protein [Myroides marinus]MDM1393280.1 hypothetical protein [Myroides marinus]